MVKLILKNNKLDKKLYTIKNISFGEICEECNSTGHNIEDRECSCCNGKGII